ncbi:hypothetical protein ACS0TY_029969 [Phlomoides rotata]
MLLLFLKMQSVEDLLQLFDNLSQRESPFWNVIILGFCKSSCCSLCRSIRSVYHISIGLEFHPTA